MAFKMKGFSGFKSSPLKQEGPVDEKNPKLQKGEMEGTFVYKGGRKSERKIDLEDRIEFLTSDIEGGSDRPNQNIADMKKTRSKLKAELAILERQGKTPPFKKKNLSKKKVGPIAKEKTPSLETLQKRSSGYIGKLKANFAYERAGLRTTKNTKKKK